MFQNFELTPFAIMVQAIGFVAMAIDLYATTQKDDRKFLWLMFTSSSIFIGHFVLLGAWTGAMAEALNAARSICALYIKKLALALGFIAIYIIVAIYTAEQLADYLPYMASIIFTSAAFFASGIRLRLLFACGQFLWVIYAIAVGSLPLLILDTLLILSTLRTAYKLKKEPHAAA